MHKALKLEADRLQQQKTTLVESVRLQWPQAHCNWMLKIGKKTMHGLMNLDFRSDKHIPVQSVFAH